MMVFSLLVLKGSDWITRTGRRLAGLLPCASPRSAQQMLPLVVTNRPGLPDGHGRRSAPCAGAAHRCEDGGARPADGPELRDPGLVIAAPNPFGHVEFHVTGSAGGRAEKDLLNRRNLAARPTQPLYIQLVHFW